MTAKPRSIFHFLVGAHTLPIEQGRIGMPKHICADAHFVPQMLSEEPHCVFHCPHFQGLWQQHAEIVQESHDAMTSLMWHKEQISVCALVLAVVDEAQTA